MHTMPLRQLDEPIDDDFREFRGVIREMVDSVFTLAAERDVQLEGVLYAFLVDLAGRFVSEGDFDAVFDFKELARRAAICSRGAK